MCKKQTCVSHSSTDSEIIFLNTNLRMDGIPVLDPCYFDITVMHSNSNQKQKDKQGRRNPLHDKASEKRLNSQANTPVSVNSASHQTRTTRTFFSWALRMAQVISHVHKSVIFGPRCHVTPWYWWACFLVFLLHISFLFVFLFIRSRIESNSHCRSTQRRVWLVDWISNTDYQLNIGLNHETNSTTMIFDQVDNYQERASLSVSEQIPYQKSRSSSRKSAASTVPTIFWFRQKSAFDIESETMFLKQVCFLIR